MLVRKIQFTEPLQADRLPLRAVVRWPGAGPESRPPVVAIGAAILLHVAACALTLVFVTQPPAPAPPDDQTVTLVFEAPQAPPPPAAEPAAPPEAPAPPRAAPPQAAAAPPQPPETAAPPPQTPPPAIEQPPEPAQPPAPPRAEAKPEAPPKPPPNHRSAAKAKAAEPARVAEPPRTPEPSAAPHPAAEQPIAADWQRSLAAWLAAHKVYPELARRRGVEGSVGLRFTADRSGRVLNVALLSSAGSPLLDAAAEKMVGDATLPPFPAGMPQQTATLTVTIRYALSN